MFRQFCQHIQICIINWLIIVWFIPRFQANQTFALVDTISEYARKWLIVSAEIRKYLTKNSTNYNLMDIRQVMGHP